MRWLLVFALVLLISSAAPVLAEEPAEAPSEPAGFTPRTSQEEEIAAAQIPGADDVNKALAELESKEREQEEWLASPEAIEQREDSLLAFGELSPEESEQLLSSVFEPQLEALNGDPSRFLSDAQLVQPLGESDAIVKDEGNGSLMDSTVPVQTENENGELAKVDLTLEATPQGFETDNAIADLTLPPSADEAIEVGEDGFAIAQAGAAESPARRFGDKNLFYPSVLPDTDLLVTANSLGAELFDLLRSEDSPEEFRFAINVPAGAELRSDDHGGAEVVREGEALTHIPPPSAVDAQQTDVPVTLEIDGSSIVLRLAHRSGDYAYPILLDPIIEDGNNWYEGKNLALLNGAWKWTSNNGNIAHDVCCWGGTQPGLLTTVQDAFYGPEQYGQWTYSTANGAVLIVHAWMNPFLRVDNGCGSQQPHDYVGLWNPGDQWHPLLTDEAKKKQGAVTLEGWGQAMVLGAGSGPPGVWLACDRNLYAGGVALWLDDTWGPGITSAGVPSGWFGDLAPANFTVSSWDEGLGVQFVKILNEGKGEVAVEKVNNCTGLYGATCPTTHNSQFNGITGDSFGEGIRNASVTVSDPTGKVAEKFFTAKVDNSPPEVALSGQLAKATGEEVSFSEGEKPVSNGEDELSLPVYKLKIEAKDGALTNDKTKRSGVKDIEVWVDGVEKSVSWSPLSSCPATSCAMTQTYTLNLTGVSAGTHKLQVKAKDFVNEVKTRDIEFEYFPATGMKDEYVMHYFPLPDGQGNEDEEEHPARPELAVNVMNGNLVYRERDVDVEGTAQVDLEVERWYNSMLPDSENTEWGDGWTLAETPSLEPIDTGGSPAPDEAQMMDSTGALETGVELPTEIGDGEFDSDRGETIVKEASGGYELTDETGESATSVVFDASGQTEARRGGPYAKLDYDYKSGDLAEIEVEDPSTFAADSSELEIPHPELVTTPVYTKDILIQGDQGNLKAPSDVAVDSQGNLWIVDKGNNRIVKLDSSGGFIAQYGSLGSGNGQFNRPTAIAIASNGDLLVTDSGNARVQRLSSSGAYLSKFGTLGTGNGQFTAPGPESLAIDASGNIWVSDTFGHRLQKFSSTGTFLKAVGSKGTGAGQFNYPAGIDIDAGGNVWVADWLNNRVEVFNSNGEFLSQFGSAGSGNGQFNQPDEIEIDKFGNVWVADQSNNRVQRFDLAGQYVGKFGTPGAGPGQFSFAAPTGIFADSKGRLWVADPKNNRVQQWLAPIGKPTYATSFGANGSGDGQFKYPSDIAVDSFGNLWVADKSNNRIEKFDSTGKFLAKFGSLGSGNGQFNRPSSIAVDRDGDILVADSNNHRIQKLNPAGEFISKFGSFGSGNGQLNKPEEVVADFKGNIWVADILNGRVQKFDEEGNFLKVVDSGQLYEPMGIDVNPGGNVWVSDWQKNRVSVFDSEGNFKSNVGSAGSGNGQFNRPDAVEIDNKGSVWVADLLNNRVQRFDLAGQYQGQFGTAGTGAGQFGLDFPSGITTDREGHLWVTDVANHRIQQWLTANYAPAQATQLDLTDGDAKVEVETPGGLVSSVTGNAAGEHDYAHEGDLLTSHDGPQGETEYDYDEDRLAKVTLPNGTWAEIDYEAAYGRVAEVRVSVEGAPVKATEFEYEDDPRRTTVIPSDAPHIVYDIGDDGSVFKWWNTQKPPELDLEGALYDNREKEEFFWEGARLLEARAESAEGIASIETIVNGDTLVDEELCPKPKAIECPKVESEWITESDLHAPGHLQLEVIATDRVGESTSERFWVNVPKPTPLAPGTPVPPRFRDIARFREEYGLEVVFPVANETELNERILDLIKAWNEPNTPAGQVARSSMDRWGVPLRPADVAEMEYRERYIENNGPVIEDWGYTHFPNSYAGYQVDHRSGGIIRIGFTEDQESSVLLIKQGAGIMAPDRTAPFSSVPAHSLNELENVEDQVFDAIPALQDDLVVSTGIDTQTNKVVVGATNTGEADSALKGILGQNAPLLIEFEEGPPEDLMARKKISGRILAGDFLLTPTSGSCTAGYGAVQKLADGNKQLFMLTAAHCSNVGQTMRRENSAGERATIGVTMRSGRDGLKEFSADGEAVALGGTLGPPRYINQGQGGLVAVKSVAPMPVAGQEVCHAGYGSDPTGTEARLCGKIRNGRYFYDGVVKNRLSVLFCFTAKLRKGDSGGPVWINGSHIAVGLATNGRGSLGNETYKETCATALLPGRVNTKEDMPDNTAILSNVKIAPLQLAYAP
jgi:tripartite motif-containing protein 71